MHKSKFHLLKSRIYLSFYKTDYILHINKQKKNSPASLVFSNFNILCVMEEGEKVSLEPSPGPLPPKTYNALGPWQNVYFNVFYCGATELATRKSRITSIHLTTPRSHSLLKRNPKNSKNNKFSARRHKTNYKKLKNRNYHIPNHHTQNNQIDDRIDHPPPKCNANRTPKAATTIPTRNCTL